MSYKPNIVYRKCLKCGVIKNQDDFRYLGGGVWVCSCSCMYTEVHNIVEM